MKLIYLSGAWVAGILLGSKISLPLSFFLVSLCPFLLLPFAQKHIKQIVLLSFCLLAFFGGIYRYQSNLPTVDKENLQFYHDSGTLEVRGVVSSDPEVRDKTSLLRFSATEMKSDEEWKAVSGTALLLVPKYPAFNYGDVLQIAGEVETPPRLDDFDYRSYLAHQEIYSIVRYPEIEVLDRGEGFLLISLIYKLRNQMAETIGEVMPEPQASVAQGIVLGIRESISTATNEAFARSGTAHLLAISGLHLSIIAGILLSVGLWLFGRRHYFYIWLALAVIWLYVLLTGVHPPVVRGAIMASFFIAAEILDRQRSATIALVLAAAIMVGITPQVIFTSSFQLSFLAMSGLIFIYPHLKALGQRVVNAFSIQNKATISVLVIVLDGFAVTAAAIIAVWPVVAYYFGIVSPLSPLTTLLVLPAFPSIIILGFLTGGLGWLFLPAGQVIAWLSWLLLSYLLLVANAFSGLYFQMDNFDTAFIWVYYPSLALILWLARSRRQTNALLETVLSTLKSAANKASDFTVKLPMRLFIPSLLVVAGMTATIAVTMPDDNLHVSFLDVGQGDAILIRTPEHQDILIDGGPSPQTLNLELSRQMPFWDRTIDLVILTHPSADHVSGLISVLERFNVKQVLYPDLPFDSATYSRWLSLIEEKNIKTTFAWAGQEIDLGGETLIEVLNPSVPPLAGTESDVDNNGIVLRLISGRVSFLLTADTMKSTEFELIAGRVNIASTVLKLAHHGSKTSTTGEFLAKVNPQVAVVSVGKDNPFGHPSPEVMAQLLQRIHPGMIFRTDEQGTVEFITDGERLWVKTRNTR